MFPRMEDNMDVPHVVLSLLVHQGSLRSCSGTSPDGAQGAQQPRKVVLAVWCNTSRQVLAVRAKARGPRSYHVLPPILENARCSARPDPTAPLAQSADGRGGIDRPRPVSVC